MNSGVKHSAVPSAPPPSSFFYFFFILVLRPFQEYLTYIEPIVLQTLAKTGEPREKPPDHPSAELGFPTCDPGEARTTVVGPFSLSTDPRGLIRCCFAYGHGFVMFACTLYFFSFFFCVCSYALCSISPCFGRLGRLRCLIVAFPH